MSFTLTDSETAALQAYLRGHGHHLGPFGPRKDGVDAKGGQLTRAAFRKQFANHFRPEFPDVNADGPPNHSVGEGNSISPPWMIEAVRYRGLKEIPGPRHHAKILEWWGLIRAPFTDDETPWCAAFVGGVLESVGIQGTRSAAARSYQSWGRELEEPAFGAVTVFWRGSRSGWSGHVAFCVGVTPAGDPICLGGNQGNAVSVATFSRSRLLGYRWPKSLAYDPQAAPVLAGAASYSTNEA